MRRHDTGAPPADVQVGKGWMGTSSHRFCNNKGDKVDRLAIPKIPTLPHTGDEGFFSLSLRPSFLFSFPPAVTTRKEQERKKKLFFEVCHQRHPREPLKRPCPRNEGQRQLVR